MAIFKTVNHKIEKSSYDIDIKNIDLASGHWGSADKMASFLDVVENFTYDKDNMSKNIVLHALKLVDSNPRINTVMFYRIPDENKIILVAITDVGKFKDFDTFSREMSITFKKDKFAFSIVEVLNEEYKDIKTGEKSFPETWKLDEQMTSRFNKLKHYQF